MQNSVDPSAQNSDTYNRGGFIAFLFSMIFSLTFFVYVAWIHPGIDLKEVPDEAIGDDIVIAGDTAPGDLDVSAVAEPWISSEELIAHGNKVYQTNCAVCHGSSGRGDGPAGRALNPPPMNFVTGQWHQGGDRVSIYQTLIDGVPGTSMVSFKHLPKVDRWAMVHFVRSLGEKKVEDNDEAVAEYARSAE